MPVGAVRRSLPLGANVLKVKTMYRSQHGRRKHECRKKYRGTLDKVLVKYVKDKLAAYPDIDPSLIFITHSGIAPEYIELVKNTLEETMHFDEIHITKASCTISSHCGSNTLGILFETC